MIVGGNEMMRSQCWTMFRRWPVATAIASGVVLSILLGVGIVLLQGDAGLASSRDLSSGVAGDRVLRIGLDYVPPEKSPDKRIYVEEGFEADLALQIGERLQARIQLVQTSPQERERALHDGRVDLLLIRSTPAERFSAEITRLDARFESGQSLAMRSDRPLREWGDLAGKTVCATEANERGQRIARGYGAVVTTVRAPAQALMLVRTGECAAAIHDRTSLDHLFGKMSWQKFSATLPPVQPSRLVALVSRERGGLAGEVERALSAIGTAEQWEQRTKRWAQLVAFEVYRDQVATDCH